ncbi:choline dehydrogenase [Ancylobacter defluvii]|uniref:Choline dehydrogenase n=1 Tax=Ancylobacter defluvii TaxID=1282440 RepID=A0A9W6JU59_9HYPH|nr:choline dehydrogenase [Ancylobacter defluvii]MBS7587469.1 choline dehydrogenase [Ancylobacter defluvii]GLK82160.1 oxygen-dependent choline dehydrogenase [Ancylobacter defluvii]
MTGAGAKFDQEFDYVIVGAGSAGCVLAERLTASGENRVLVLEFGGSDRSIFIQMPSALSIPMNMPRYSWMYESEPEPGLGGRRLHCPRGKVLGGSSSINGLVYVRGNPADFDGWQEQGAQGWSYADVLPYFRRAESRQEGGDAYRGGDGPLSTRYGSLANPLHHAFLEAARQAGYPASDDVNGYAQEGFGRMDMTVKDGVRWSAANAYLRPAMKRDNLKVETHARVTQVVFEGRRAVGVAYERGGVRRQVRATREVILAGGPINSPQLLKLSGVGPAAELRGFGIDMVADRPGVGENLQDHLEFYFQVACKQPITLYSSMGLVARAGIGLRWLLRRDGLGATNHFESCGFIRSRPGVASPDIQYHFLPLAVTYDGQGLASEHGFQAHVGPMRSKSRGWVRLRSADPADKPRLFFNYMSHPDDWTEMRACVRLTREIFAQKAFDRYRGREIQPGADVVDDEAIDGFIRDKVESAYHPSCTCKMGALADPLAVVDPQARVIGVEGLRVVDSSIMPSVTTGNLNAPTIMLAEKAADHILGRPALAPSNAPYYRAANWQHAQR